MWMWLTFIVWMALAVGVFGWALPVIHEPRAANGAFTVYGYLKDWQTGLGAVVGFLGLMLVEIVRRTVERHDNRTAVKHALAVEIARMKESLNIAARNLETALRGDQTASFGLSTAQIALLKLLQHSPPQRSSTDLGLLTRSVREAALNFYSEHRRACGDVEALLSCFEDGEAQDASFVRTLAETTRKTLDDAIVQAETALRHARKRT